MLRARFVIRFEFKFDFIEQNDCALIAAVVTYTTKYTKWNKIRISKNIRIYVTCTED